MKRLAILVATIAMVIFAPAANAAPPEDRVSIVGPFVDVIDCDGVSIARTQSGWLGIPANAETPFHYYQTWVYENAEGESWSYIDTGLVRTFERDGALYISLSGRSINVGPDETAWIGHWQLNTVTEEVWRAGFGPGATIDQLACDMLT